MAELTGTTVPFASFQDVSFGTPLAPLGAPSDRHQYTEEPPMTIDTGKLYQMTISTSLGNIVLGLQPDLAPRTVNVIVTLARNGFYDGVKFHRVVPDFVIQGGDPTGTGRGGPGFRFMDEPVKQDYVPGALAMANAGPNTNGSQFFICTADDRSLPKQYNLFGKVVEGMDAVLAVREGTVMDSVTVQEQQ